MITNDVQYRTAKAHVDRLTHLLDDVRNRAANTPESEMRHQLELDAVAGQMDELRAQLKEYDDLREGRVAVGPLSTIDDLPRLLVRARIAAGLSQRELAGRLGLKEQQIQRYEATQYASASLSRLREVAAELDLHGAGLPEDLPTTRQVVKRLGGLGLPSSFVRQRIAPATLRESTSGTDIGAVIDLASRVGRIFGWDATGLLAGANLRPDENVLAMASFKLPKTTDRERIATYTVYSHYLALLALQATQGLPSSEIPDNPESFREAWHAYGRSNDFEDLLNFTWSLGVPVLPLNDTGFFHAAAWKVSGRPVIVLKQGQRKSSRWMFDLLHELGHIIGDLKDLDGSVIDGDIATIDDAEEAANSFAGDVLLDNRAEEIVQLCVRMASGKVERLKRVVPEVAAEEGVDVGSLANYVAFRLSMQDINWWGAASNLQVGDHDPWALCRDALIARADLASLNPLDRELLNQALVEG